MGKKFIKALLVEDNPDDVVILKRMLSEAKGTFINLRWVGRLSEALEYLMEERPEVILLDLNLPDSQGLDTFIKIHAQASEIPIIVLTGCEDEDLATMAVREGAQDYLVKGTVNSRALLRVINYAIERQQLVAELYHLSRIDELTKLWNRRVFYEVLQMEHDRFERCKNSVCLLYIDIDNFKDYNDKYGHSEGDNVIVQLANVIRNRLRKADMGFRLAGEEFTVILPGTSAQDALSVAEKIRSLFESIEFHPKQKEESVHKTVSIGIAELNHDITSIEFLKMADQAMYKAKREGKNRVCFL